MSGTASTGTSGTRAEDYRHKVGELRPSQALTTFGVGSVIDLPHLSVMAMGLDEWPERDTREVTEDRLLAAVREVLGDQVEALRSTPVPPDEGGGWNPFGAAERVGVPVAPFPRWMVCPFCRKLAPLSAGLFEVKANPYRPDETRYVHPNCQKAGRPPAVVPARFLVACRHGHLDDFPWVRFVHAGQEQCPRGGYSLELIEYGSSGEAANIQVKCVTCGANRRMSDAFDKSAPPVDYCRGRRPHLRDYETDTCETDGKPTPARPILHGASNAWFPVLLSALNIPRGGDNRLADLVEQHWSELNDVESERDIERDRKRGGLRAFDGFEPREVLRAVESRRSSSETPDAPADLKTPEWEVFSNPSAAPSGGDFRLREVAPPERYGDFFERVVLAERLREVRALVGFTRIESPYDEDVTGDELQERRAPLSRRHPAWVPAGEVRGEGLFFQWKQDRIEEWLLRPAVRRRAKQFQAAHATWRRQRGLPPDGDPTLRFVLLHSLSHALIRQLAVECGYTAASIRERIYCRPPGLERTPAEEGGGPPMSGLLLYTAAADSEGTLGGLVSLGETDELGRHLDEALGALGLCASDPLCSEHRPGEGNALHGAACHACQFAPETSCERGNRYLDRSLLVPTVDGRDGSGQLAFFTDLFD